MTSTISYDIKGLPDLEIVMTIKRSPSAAKRVEGSLIEALGKLTGDKEGEAKGAAKKLEGEAEEAAIAHKKPVRK